MQIQSAVGTARDAWRLAKPYWMSEERWSAWGLLLAVVTLNLGNVYISVRINEWNKAFYNALQAFNGAGFFRQLGIFGILVAAAIAMSVYALYLKQMLQIRWRRWLTRKYLAAWLADRAYYQLQLGSTTDNPDQRISEDLDQFTAYVMNLSVSFISSGRLPGFVSRHPLGPFWAGGDPTGQVGNVEHPCLSSLGCFALCRSRHMGHHKNRPATGALEFCPAALRG
jgi:ABC-type uncharacterized transport system fused permease/ATPase subunit